MVVNRLKLRDINEHLQCGLCHGYFIDASTITNCNHSFCRSCLLKHLNIDATCPKCSCNKIKFRSDRILQRLVYKLVPNLYHNEVCRRQVFAAFDAQSSNLLRQSSQPQSDTASVNNYNIVTCSDIINLKVTGKVSGVKDVISFHLNCPSLLTIGLLCKFIRAKFEVGKGYEVLFHHQGELLHHHYNLIDVAYITNTSKDCLVYLEFMIMSLVPKDPPPTPHHNIPVSKVKKKSPRCKSQSIKSYLMKNLNTTSFNPLKTSTPLLLLDTPPLTTPQNSSSPHESPHKIPTSEPSKLPVLSDTSSHTTTTSTTTTTTTSIVSPSQNTTPKVRINYGTKKASSGNQKNSKKRTYTRKKRFSTLSIRSLLKNCVRSFNQPIKLEEISYNNNTTNNNNDDDGGNDERMKMETMTEEEVEKYLQTQKNKQHEISASSSLPNNPSIPSQLQILLSDSPYSNFPTSNINPNNTENSFPKTIYINDIFPGNLPLTSYLNTPINLNKEANLTNGISHNGHINSEDKNGNDISNNTTNDNNNSNNGFIINNNNLHFLLNIPYSNILPNKPYLTTSNHIFTDAPNINSNGILDMNCGDNNHPPINNTVINTNQPINNILNNSQPIRTIINNSQANDLVALFNTNLINNNNVTLKDHFSTLQHNIPSKINSDTSLQSSNLANINNEVISFNTKNNNSSNNYNNSIHNDNNESGAVLNNKMEEDDDRQLFTPASCDERQTLPSSLFVDVEE